MEVIPYAVIAMLTVSLFESTFVLPLHLAHPHNGSFEFIGHRLSVETFWFIA